MSLSDLPSIDRQVSQRISDFWSKHCDPYLAQLPFFDSPVVYVSGLVSVSLIILLLRSIIGGPKSSERTNRKPVSSMWSDVRPILLIHNGFCFGVYGVGLLILLTQSQLGNLLHACHAPAVTEFHQQAVKHTVYTYHLVSFACLVDPVIRVMGRRSLDVAGDIVHQVSWSFLLFLYSCLNPIGIPVSIVILDACHNVLRFGYSVLVIADSSAQPEPLVSRTAGSKFGDGMRALFFSVISAHAYQTQSFIRSNGCRPPTLASDYFTGIFFPVAVYSAIVSALSVLRLVSHFLPPETQMQKHQVLASSSGRASKKNVKVTKTPGPQFVK